MKGFYIQISNGLLYDGHRKRMGAAVWEFMWLLDRMTSISEEGVGTVMGGRPIKLEEIANNEVRKQTVSDDIIKLKNEGYINVTRTGYGLIITINNAQKVFGRRTINQENQESGKTGIRKTVIQNQENRDSNIYIQDNNNKTITPQAAVDENPTKESNISKDAPQVPPPPKPPTMTLEQVANQGKKIAESGRDAIELTKRQESIITLNKNHPWIKQIRSEYLKVMEQDYEDGGSEIANIKAWIEIYEKRFKKDKDKLMEFIKKIHADKFWHNKATSGIKIRMNFEAIRKGDNTFTPLDETEGKNVEGYSKNELLEEYYKQQSQANGTTIEEERVKFKAKQAKIHEAMARGEL